MEKIDRQLLIKEISTRLPFMGVKVQVFVLDEEKGEVAIPLKIYSINTDGYISLECNHYDVETVYVEDCRLYLRPLSSMTEEEILELYKIAYDTWYSDSLYYKSEEWISFRDSIRNNTLCFKSSIWASNIFKVYDWLNSNNFDYNGLIPMGLGIDCTKLDIDIYDSSIKV